MRIKFLALIASFLFVSIVITSCLNSDSTSEYSSDPTIHAFGIDTIHGKSYKFTIDQLSGTIYNTDSLPFRSDTIIDRILIKTLQVTGLVTSGLTDTIFKTNDSVDLRQPITLKAHAADGVTTKTYTVRVNVHQQDPDLLVWKNMEQPLSSTPISQQKSVLLEGHRLFVYTSYNEVYHAITDQSPFQWQQSPVTGLPDNIKLSSIINFKETLYLATESGDVYSSTDGLNWGKVSSLSTGIATLIGSFTNSMIGIQTINGKNYFCTSADAKNWTKGEVVPDNFPQNNIYSTVFKTSSGLEEIVSVGNIDGTSVATIPWFSMDGATWADLSTTSEFYCPVINNPAIIRYDDAFYMFGGNFNTIYKSLTGIAWNATKKGFLLPEEMAGNNAYSMVVDKDNYIWIIIGQKTPATGGTTAGEVWRGRLNKLGFLIQ